MGKSNGTSHKRRQRHNLKKLILFVKFVSPTVRANWGAKMDFLFLGAIPTVFSCRGKIIKIWPLVKILPLSFQIKADINTNSPIAKSQYILQKTPANSEQEKSEEKSQKHSKLE